MSNKPKFEISQPKDQQQEEQIQKIEDLKRRLVGKSLFVATPMFGGVCHGMFAKSINELLIIGGRLGVEVRTSNIFNESLINRARNYLLQTFLDSEMTHIMWIDADISFNAYDIFTLLAYCDAEDPFTKKSMDIVGGLYPKKTLAADKMVAAVKAGLCDVNPEDIFKYSADLVVNPVGGGGVIDITKPIQVSEIGTGFMLMSKESVNKMRRKNEQLKYTPDHIRTPGFDGSRKIYNLFEILIDPDSNRLLSEDYGFLRLARKIDLNIFVFPWIKLIHIGNWFFQGDLQSLAVLYNKIGDDYHISMSGPLVKKETTEVPLLPPTEPII
jgi:hypothetical protein